MLERALNVIPLIIGTAIGGVIGANSGLLRLPITAIGGIAGTILAYTFLHFVRGTRSKRKSNDDRPRTFQPTPMGTQVPFHVRMANYLKLDETEVLQSDSYKSSMPFWSLIDKYWLRSTRSAQEIRTILLRIRDHLRSSR